MKRPFLALCAVVAVAGFAFPAANAAADPGMSFAVGGFQGGIRNQNIGFSAHYTGAGEVVGYVSETLAVSEFPLSTLRGEVECLAVSGNRAAVGYLVQEASGIFASLIGTRQMLLVQDSEAGDTFAFGFITDCTAAISIEPVFPIEDGNIIVRA